MSYFDKHWDSLGVRMNEWGNPGTNLLSWPPSLHACSHLSWRMMELVHGTIVQLDGVGVRGETVHFCITSSPKNNIQWVVRCKLKLTTRGCAGL